MNATKQQSAFLWCSGAIFTLFSVAKFATAAGVNSLLDAQDPVLLVFSSRQLLVLSAVMEMVMVFYVVHNGSSIKSVLAVAWLSTFIASYRFAKWAMGLEFFCNCMGAMPSWIKLTNIQLDIIALSILVATLCGSYWLIYLQYADGRQSSAQQQPFDAKSS